MSSAKAITPEIVREHGLSDAEYDRILGLMGREPSMVELGIFSVMWSEHCSYKSTRAHLKNCRPRPLGLSRARARMPG